jgi:hypothetical protein
MKLLALPLMLLMATPANAITWREFWEPFEVEHHHHHRPRRRQVCTEEVYREVRNRRGHFVEYYYETVRVPCYRYRRY